MCIHIDFVEMLFKFLIQLLLTLPPPTTTTLSLSLSLSLLFHLSPHTDTVREQCATQDVHRTLNGLLKDCIKLKSDDEVIIKYKTVVCGCTLNLCCSNGKGNKFFVAKH